MKNAERWTVRLVRSSSTPCELHHNFLSASDFVASTRSAIFLTRSADSAPQYSAWVTSLCEGRSDSLRSKQYEDLRQSLQHITIKGSGDDDEEDGDDDDIRISSVVSKYITHILVLLEDAPKPLPPPQLAPVSETVCALVWTIGGQSRYVAVSPSHMQVMDIDADHGTRVDGRRHDIHTGINRLLAIAAPNS